MYGYAVAGPTRNRSMEDQAQQSCPRVALSSLTRSEFEAEYLAPNLPVLLTGATDGWRAAKEWVQWPLESPAVARLAELFGHHSVTVHGARNIRARHRAQRGRETRRVRRTWTCIRLSKRCSSNPEIRRGPRDLSSLIGTCTDQGGA